MILRLLFFLLLLANVVYYGWQTAAGAGDGRDRQAAPALPPEVPQLVLLEERERELLATDTTVPAGEPGDASNCYTLGPFSNQADLRRAFNAIAPHIARSRQRQSVETEDRGFWVFLPAVASREEALRLARDLNAAGLRDYYVVTAGEEENTISLGLFRQEANAQRRREALAALGFEAQLERRREETVSYWLDYARLPNGEPPWQRIVASANGLEHRPISCFR